MKNNNGNKTHVDKQIQGFFEVPDHIAEQMIRENYPQKNIFRQILDERNQQNERWGGPAHDSNHTTKDWERYIQKHLERWMNETGQDKRYAMIRVAALAVAAIEAYDANGMCWFEDTGFANKSIEDRR